MLRIACIGEVTVEIIATSSSDAQLGIAGDTYNTAIYLARLLDPAMARVSCVTALGCDTFSERIRKHMHNCGIDGSHVERREDKVPGLYAIETDETGERSFTYWRSDSAARTLFSWPCVITPDVVNNFDIVFATGISIAILPPEVRLELLDTIDAFRARGGKFVYDSNHRPQLWESLDAAERINSEFWKRADVALPSLNGEFSIFGDANEIAVLDRIRGLGCKEGALKRGALGPLSIDPTLPQMDFAPAMQVVDTTAAGDSFNAGFLACWLMGGGAPEAMTKAHNLACQVIAHRGAIIPR